MNTAASPRMEDYLEAILSLRERKPVVRAGELARTLKVSRPTVTAALATLVEAGLVEHERYGYIRLTPKGQRIAQRVSRRHKLLSSFLKDVLGMSLKQAAEDACRLEHYVSPEAVERLERFVEFVGMCPRCGPVWREHLASYCGGERAGRRHVQRQDVAACIAELPATCSSPCCAGGGTSRTVMG